LQEKYSYKVIRQLYAHDELIRVGMDKNINGLKEVIHRLKDRDSFYLKHMMKTKWGKQAMNYSRADARQ